jgi:hypothetical protein
MIPPVIDSSAEPRVGNMHKHRTRIGEHSMKSSLS